jgi:NAD(P)-dependent dehydrogenase (short-subunit alcohol dehydrogenase family)
MMNLFCFLGVLLILSCSLSSISSCLINNFTTKVFKATKMSKLVWLVTGCSSGLGAELVHSILARGDRVIATGRNTEVKLAHLKGTGAAILDIDVTAPQAELDTKIEKALAIYGGIDVVVPNAGYSEMGFVEELRQVH